MNTLFLQKESSLAQQLCSNKLFSYMVIKPYLLALIKNNILTSDHYQYFSLPLMLSLKFEGKWLKPKVTTFSGEQSPLS
jgi:hypothetical protein